MVGEDILKKYSLFNRDIFSLLKNGYNSPTGEYISPDIYFRRCISQAVNSVSIKSFGHEVYFSKLRIGEAQAYWIRDINRIDVEGDDPNEFKLAGFLTYWLRRRITAEKCVRLRAYDLESERKFNANHNEICAFIIGFHLCAYFHFRDMMENEDDISDAILKLNVSNEYLFDVSTLMKNKNISPHSMYLIYKSLFMDLEKPIGMKTAEIVALG